MGILHNYKQILSQNRIAQLLQMHKQALEKRWHLGGMEAYASNSALRDHYVFHVARACLWCIVKVTQTCTIRPFRFPSLKEAYTWNTPWIQLIRRL